MRTGSRFANFTYDAQGRGSASEYAGGVNKVTVTYGSSVVLTDARGTSQTLTFQTTLGMRLLKTVQRPCNHSSCGWRAAKDWATTPTATSPTRKDFNGNRTNCTFDLSAQSARPSGSRA